MSWASRPPARAGRYPRGDELEATYDQIESLTSPGWFDYTTVAPPSGSAFSLSATTTPPTQGNSTYTAHCRKSVDSDLVIARIYIVIGSTFSAGSGTYQFGLPYAMASTALGNVGSAYILDSGTAHRAGVVIQGTSTSVIYILINGAASGVTHNSPQTWATGDEIRIDFTYQPA